MVQKVCYHFKMDVKKISTQCCIAGGGPAGIMTGFLLARAGVDVIVLEKWPDFFRDFRGDTVHPSTMEILKELNLLDAFLKLNPNKTYQLAGEIGGQHVILADFSHLNITCPFIAFIPQWDFLNFIAEEARQYPNFKLLMNTEAIGLIEESGQIKGVLANDLSTNSRLEINATLIVGADGRHSTLREKSGLTIKNLSAPMDVLWFRLSRKETDPKETLGKVDLGKILIMIERDTYWQCGFLIRKGGYEVMKQGGLANFHENVIKVAPLLKDRISEIKNWDQIKMLEVKVDRLLQWHRSHLLCIGDAAHAMSPIGGVGINLAIQDAVATANLLTVPLLKNKLTAADLSNVQRRRQTATILVQSIQVFIQNHIIERVLGRETHPQVPFIFKLLQWFPYLRRVPAYLVGIGFRPEHIKNRDTK